MVHIIIQLSEPKFIQLNLFLNLSWSPIQIEYELKILNSNSIQILKLIQFNNKSVWIEMEYKREVEMSSNKTRSI